MNRSYGIFGLGAQTGTTPASAPSTSFYATADSPGIDASSTTDPLRLTNGQRDTTVDRYISGSEATAQVTTICTADSLPQLLYAALGNIAATGSSAPYTQDITMGSELPYFSFFQQVGSSAAALQRLASCKVASLELAASGTTPPTLALNLAGTKPAWLSATTWSGPSFDIDNGYFKTIGAEVLFSLVDANPAAPPSSVTLSSVNVQIQNSLTALTELGEITPEMQEEGAATVTVSIEGTTSDTELYRIVKTGSASGTELAGDIVVGSCQITFPHSEEDWEFVTKLGAVPWRIEAMNVGVEGGPFDLRLSTDGAIAVNGTSVEFLVETDVASFA